jgi:hypothetical protein
MFNPIRKIPMTRYPLLFALAGTLLAAPTQAVPTGLYFSHGDWELACDNTGTCRAAGYHGDDKTLAVSVLLTRKAGPGQAVTGEMATGEYGENKELNDLPKKFRLTLRINGKNLGQFAGENKSAVAKLSAPQVSALLAAAVGSGSIEWQSGATHWELSGKGATAVLLKMDEFQGRIGTSGALVKKGARGEDAVLPASLPPVVQAAPLPKALAGDAQWLKKHEPALRQALKRSLKKDDNCDYLTEANDEPKEITLSRLSAGKLLVSTACWRAAYNDGGGYWVIDDSANFNPVLVTTDGSDYTDGRISASHKGRGLGDCWGHESWVWDGKQFVHTEVSSTGMCKLMAPGGVWSLPTLVTEVKPAGH